MNNIEYTKEGLHVWRAYGIGSCNFVPWSNFREQVGSTYIHTYIYLISRFEIRNCTADVDLLLLSLDARTKIYKTII